MGQSGEGERRENKSRGQVDDLTGCVVEKKTPRKEMRHRDVCCHGLKDYNDVYCICIGFQVSAKPNFYFMNVAKCIFDRYCIWFGGSDPQIATNGFSSRSHYGTVVVNHSLGLET